MKKILVLAAALVLFAAAACAERRAYIEAGTMDTDGNVTTIADLTDPRYIAFDDQTMECAYGTKDTLVSGTCEVTEQADDSMTLVASFENEEPVTLDYIPSEDVFTVTDDTAGTVYVFTRVEVDETAVEAAEGTDDTLHDRKKERDYNFWDWVLYYMIGYRP